MIIRFNLISVAFLSIGYIYIGTEGTFDTHSKEFYMGILAAIFTDSLSMAFFRKNFPKFMKYLGTKLEKQINFESQDKESIILEKASSHMKGIEAVGGKLFLTNERLVFKSHKFNIQNHEQEFELSKINKIHTQTHNNLNFEYEGQLEKFIVEQPEILIEQLEMAKSL